MFTLLGDPHLGRSFVRNVPLHRRGDREAMVWDTFEKSVKGCEAPLHICMGDLFDKWSVSYDAIARAARTYLEAPETTTYVVLQGNHDASRDLRRTSAFDLFAAIVANRSNVHVVREALSLDGRLYLGWQPVETAESLFLRSHTNEVVSFGHWDISGDSPNLIPLGAMARAGITNAYTGHVHQPDNFVSMGVEVNVVGSMQPYAHGEGDMYVTVGLDEVRDHPEYYHDKCVRLKLAPGETLDFTLDCLQLQIDNEKVESDDTRVEYQDFNMDALFEEAFTKEGVPDDIRKELLDKYRNV